MFGRKHPVFKQIQAIVKDKILKAQEEYDAQEKEIAKQHRVGLRNLKQQTASSKELAATEVATKFFGNLF